MLANNEFKQLLEKDDAFRKVALDEVRKGAAAALKASSEKYKEMEEQFRVNAQLREDIKNLKVELDDQKETLQRNIVVLQEKLEKARAAKDVPVAAANPKGEGVGNLHSLVLDISRGKAGWDVAVGRVIKVLDGRQVVINLGEDDGIKPQLTFNVFLAREDGRPDRELKGTIEVVRAIDGKTALANITSQTSKDFPVAQGDGLFNPFFGAHVAIAGQVNWFGRRRSWREPRRAGPLSQSIHAAAQESGCDHRRLRGPQ